MVSITRCAAECDTPNNGPIWRTVRFVRQYVDDQQHTISQVKAPLAARSAIGDLVTATFRHDPHQLLETDLVPAP